MDAGGKMKSLLLIVFVGLTACATNSNQSNTNLAQPRNPSSNISQAIEFVEHPDCTELRLAPTSAPVMAWHMSGGGGATQNMFNLNHVFDVKKNYPLGSYAGTNETSWLTVNLTGQALPTYSPQMQAYYSFWLSPGRQTNVGFAEIVQGGHKRAYSYATGETIETSELQSHPFNDLIFADQIQLAVIYADERIPTEKKFSQDCAYSPGQNGIEQIRSQKCAWIDGNSRSTSGKPFCFADASAMKLNSGQDMQLPR